MEEGDDGGRGTSCVEVCGRAAATSAIWSRHDWSDSLLCFPRFQQLLLSSPGPYSHKHLTKQLEDTTVDKFSTDYQSV